MALTYGLCLGTTNAKYTAEQFSRIIQNVAGDGVCAWGSAFAASVEGLTLTLGSGFALAEGHWVKNDSPLELSVTPAYNYTDRTDLAVVQVDHAARQASLVLLENADPANLPEEPYTVPLYLIRVKRGATNLLATDITDLRSHIQPLSAQSKEGLRAYAFVHGGIDQEVARLLGLGEEVMVKAQNAIIALDKAIANAGGMPEIGETTTARRWPEPMNQWLLCDGSAVPPEYVQLQEMIGPELPATFYPDPRFGCYIFGGEPEILP